MRRRDKTSGKAAKTQRLKTLKRRNAPKTARRSSSLAPGKVTDVIRERDEALEQLAATSDVLQIISKSPGKLEPVLTAMLDNAVPSSACSFYLRAMLGAQSRYTAPHRRRLLKRGGAIPCSPSFPALRSDA